jgi:hypothetical protein
LYLQPGTNLVLPPNYQLPPGTMLVKNEQGQLMLVTQQQAQAYKVQTRVSKTPREKQLENWKFEK